MPANSTDNADSSPNTSRREFLRQAGLSGIALTIGACLPAFGERTARIINTTLLDNLDPTAPNMASGAIELMSWITIDQTGKVTIRSHRSEMGQGTFQALPQMIAEELEVNLDQVNIQFAPANPKKYGPQPQEGSFSVRGWYKELLRIGASAREMLIEAAARQWKVAPSECYAENGEVIHRPSGRKTGYGALVEDASGLPAPTDVKVKQRKDYKIIGKPLPRQDIPLKTNGAAIFGLDKKLPGMLYAVVERSPRIRGKVKTFDASATLAVPGVKRVFKVQRAVFSNLQEGVAVVADSIWTAMQGRKVLKVEWNDDEFEHLDSDLLLARMREDLGRIGPSSGPSEDSIETALQKSAKKIEAIYETPYQSHSCMEPLNCIADVKDNSIDIWGPIQEANWIQADLSERMGTPVANITVNMTFLGGGFGRKAFPDYPHEAVLISKEMKAPVQVVWTREDDMSQGPFRPGPLYQCRGGLDENGLIRAFQTNMASQFFGVDKAGNPDPPSNNKGFMDGMPGGYLASIPHFSFGGVGVSSPIPTMWWRSVFASTGGFASESFIDELAHEAGQDPLDFRRKHLKEPRYQALIDRMEAVSGWKDRKEKEKNTGWGVAITESFGSIVAQIVKVSGTTDTKRPDSRSPDGKIKIDKVIALMDCGWYVNPDIIRAQVEGSIVMGLGAAIKHATHFKDGMTVEKNFNTYAMPRINDIPEIEVYIMENDEKAGGVGEPGLPAFAPALCNAIFDLTGKRIRKLPFDLNNLPST